MKNLYRNRLIGVLIVGFFSLSSGLNGMDTAIAQQYIKNITTGEEQLKKLKNNPKATEKQIEKKEKDVQSLRQMATDWVSCKYKSFNEMNVSTKVLVATLGIAATAMTADYVLTGGAWTQYAWDQVAKGVRNIGSYFFSSADNELGAKSLIVDSAIVQKKWNELRAYQYIPNEEALSNLKKMGFDRSMYHRSMGVGKLLHLVLFDKNIPIDHRKEVLGVLAPSDILDKLYNYCDMQGCFKP
jgi:hypothetical protein